jgi:hypothetical protein
MSFPKIIVSDNAKKILLDEDSPRARFLREDMKFQAKQFYNMAFKAKMKKTYTILLTSVVSLALCSLLGFLGLDLRIGAAIALVVAPIFHSLYSYFRIRVAVAGALPKDRLEFYGSREDISIALMYSDPDDDYEILFLMGITTPPKCWEKENVTA